jgi:hypothetical protein
MRISPSRFARASRQGARTLPFASQIADEFDAVDIIHLRERSAAVAAHPLFLFGTGEEFRTSYRAVRPVITCVLMLVLLRPHQERLPT